MNIYTLNMFNLCIPHLQGSSFTTTTKYFSTYFIINNYIQKTTFESLKTLKPLLDGRTPFSQSDSEIETHLGHFHPFLC